MIIKKIYDPGGISKNRIFKNTVFNVLIFFLCGLSALSQTFPSGFSQVKVGTIYYPTSMAFAPDGRIFCTEKAGKVKIIKNGVVLGTSFLSVSVNQLNERGLSSVILDPDFSSNHYVYIYYTTASSPIRNRLSRFTANGDVAVPGSEVVIIDFEPCVGSIHNGGGMAFGPDGKLYIAIGNDNVNSYSQDLNTYKGKVLRINKDGTVPSGNPFTGSEPAKRIWALGLRNPWTISIQPGTGKIFVNDVGEGAWEEINDCTAPGRNFGWPGSEGYTSNPAYTSPVYAYPHGTGLSAGCSITGGEFFNPSSTNYPAQYTGKYFFIDYCNKWINYLDLSNGVVKQNFASNLTSSNNYLKLGKDGNLYYYSIGQNSLYKIIYNSNSAPAITSHPVSKSVSAGQNVTFNVSASGSQPLSYQWQKNGINISGANSSAYTINNVQSSHAGSYRCIVSNSFGSATSNSATLTVAAFNNSPQASILTPAVGTLYRGGDVISFSGNATDAEDGTLPASAFKWTIEFRHDSHVHPGPNVADGVKSGSFTVPTDGEKSANVYYRIILIVTDSKGAVDSAYRDVYPKKSTITLVSQPAGLKVNFNDQPHNATYSAQVVSGMIHSFGAVSPQTFNGLNYTFSHWLHGGSASQTIAATDINKTFTVVYNSTGPAPDCSASGKILREYWANFNSTSLSDIPVNSTPTGTTLLSMFEGPSHVADHYASRIRGFICPPATGNYTFWIASDNASELYLSTNDLPSNKIKIASVSLYTQPREWTKYAEQKSASIYLVAGQKYYIEAIHRESVQGDHLSVGWALPGGTLERPIPGTRLSPPGNNLSVNITSPANNSAFSSGANITINAAVSGGTAQKVEFFSGGTKLGEDTSSPYSYTWINVPAGAYTLTAKVTDTGNNTATSPPVKISVNSTGACTASGNILREYWANYNSNSLSNIPVNSTPTGTTLLSMFEGPSHVADHYASRIRGFICPPATGNYTFWIASDNASELYVSTNDLPSNKIKIAGVSLYTQPREWTKYAEQKSASIYLVAGQKYYIEAIHRESVQGDHLSVGWALPGGTLERPIPGTRLSPPGNNLSVNITSPANNSAFSSGANITINAAVSGGTAQKVEFFSGGTKLGEDTSSPYSYTWINVPAGAYTLTAKVTDTGNNTATSPPVKISVNSTGACTASGNILREIWHNVSGTSVSNIPVHTAASATSHINSFQTTKFEDNYGQRVRGFICPPTSGNYIFWIASDDNSELWLSTNDQPAGKVKIASVSGWTSFNEWTKYASQQSAPVNLVAGQKYYIEALHKEGSQGDHLSVGWQLPGGTLERPIPGSRLSPSVYSITPQDLTMVYTQNVFAIIGDYGFAGTNEATVANLVKSWNPEYIVTTGDNNYPDGAASTIDANIGQYYRSYIFPYTGSYGSGADINRFFPSLGNHDWNTPGAVPYQNYFSLPGNERYYDFKKGDIHFFVIDSDPSEPDGTSSNSTQGLWLMNALQNSNSKWKIVYFHHAPYVSDQVHGSQAYMQWPFKTWGADIVISGHSHIYERINRDNFPYIVNGLGGHSKYSISSAPISGSVIRYNANYGAVKVNVKPDTLWFRFYNIDNQLIDAYPLVKEGSPCAAYIQPGGSTTFCSGGNVTLNSNTGAGFSYQWIKNGANISGANASSYNTSTSGNYQVRISYTGCTAWSAPTMVTVNTSLTSRITPGGPTSFCQGESVTLYGNTCSGYVYQWKKDGTDIPGATSSNYVATTSGSYQLKIVQGASVSWSALVDVTVNNCGQTKKNTSDTLKIKAPDEDSFKLSVYPNPTSGLFTFDFCLEDVTEQVLEVTVYSIGTGRVVYRRPPVLTNGCVRQSIELPAEIATGVYLLQIKLGAKTENTKVILYR